jgi:threonine dehydratase
MASAVDELPISVQDVLAAAERIRPYVHRTPVHTSATLDRELGLRAFFKCENLQKVGAFKARGAVNAVLSLPDDVAGRGVVTHSSGNHGAALAYAASIRGVPCTVVMPHDASDLKFAAVEGYGGRIVRCAQNEREETAAEEQRRTGAALVHPYDDPAVIAGQGTAALELLDDVPGLSVVIAPVGGGGLLSGTSLVAHQRGVDVIGAEPEEVDDAYRSLASGRLQPRVPHPQTLADGLLTGLGRLPFAILSATGAHIVLVSEAEIVRAARFHLERMKLVVEPSGATPLAALRAGASDLRRHPGIGVIVSGGNTDLAWMRG